MLEVVASTAQQLRGNGNDTTSATAQLYTAVLEKLDNLSKNVTTNNSLKEIFPTQSILTTVKPILPSVKNLPFTPAIPVRNIGDLEKNTTTGKTEDKIPNTLLERVNNIFDKFKDVKQQAASQTLLPAATTANAEKPSYIEKKSHIEEDEDSIASDVKGIFNLLKKVFGEGGRLSSGAEQNAASGFSTAAAGGPLGLATYFLLRKYGSKFKNATKGKTTETAETTEPVSEETGETNKARLEDHESRLKTAKQIEGPVIEPTESKIPKAGELVRDTKIPITEVSTLGKVGKVAGKAAVPLAIAAEGYGAYTDIKQQTAEVDAQQKAGRLTAEQAKIKKGEVVYGTGAKTIARTAGGLAGAEVGALTGAATGAAIGSVVPLIGTAIGGVAGGLIGGGIGYFAGQKVTDATGISKSAEELGKTVGGDTSGVTESERKQIDEHLKEMRAKSDAKARALGFKDQEEQVKAIKSGLVKPNEHKPELKETKPETIKEESVKEKTGITGNESSSVLKVIADNTNKTNASIQGLTAGIYKLAEAIAKNQGVKGSAPAISLSPNISQDTQQTPSAVEYAAMYTSPGQQIRQKAFATYNK